jgi:hypothetical protein
MRISVRFAPRHAHKAVGVALLSGLLVVLMASTAGAFGFKTVEAGTCTVGTCKYSTPSDFYTQAAGHPNFGVTDFKFKVSEEGIIEKPEGAVKKIRVDLPVGLSVNPEATEKCKRELLAKSECPAASRVGEDLLTVSVGLLGGAKVELKGEAYNLERPNGIPTEVGVEVNVPALGINQQIYIVGGVSWNTDYHEYFTISEIPNENPLIESRLIFNGQAGTGFLTLPSVCAGPQTTIVTAESYEGTTISEPTNTPTGATGCDKVPFAPTLSLNPSTTQSDQPDGAAVDLHVPQNASPTAIDSSTLATARVALPEGMTLNPSAANGLKGCSNAQIGIGTTNPVSCPAESKIGAVAIETPNLPAGALTGNVYLGEPLNNDPVSGPESGQEYRLFLDAESSTYGVSVRLEGKVSANKETGRLTATFADNPQIPFEDLRLTFNREPAALVPLANPLACGAATATTSLTPYSGQPAASPEGKFTVDADGKGGTCPNPLSFSLAQSTQTVTATAGAYSPYTLNLARADGQQYLSQIKTTLPAGLLGAIPSVALCNEPQAGKGECAETAKIGTTTVTAGSGTSPYSFAGNVYLTGPTNGAPYGLSIVVPAVAGPYNLGNVIVRAGISVDPYTARVTVLGAIPTVVGGVPLRLKSISVAINRANFMFNPTNCGVLATESRLTSVLNATLTLSTPFQVGNCTALPFKPKLTALAGAKTSKANGAGLEVKVAQGAHQANLQKVVVSLPKQLPSRLTTLQKACPAAAFEAGLPGGCPAGSRVGGATASTPVLPGTLSGPAYLVSHGGEAFPDLDLVLRSEGGVKIVLVGHTQIKNGVTTSTFESLPDAPISSFSVKLPVGSTSALTANGSLCAKTLLLPTTLLAQSGAKITQSTKLSVTGCPVTVTGSRISGHTVDLTVQAPAAGRISASGPNLRTVKRKVSKAGKYTIKVLVTNSGARALNAGRILRIKARVGFIPTTKHPTSKAFKTLTLKG